MITTLVVNFLVYGIKGNVGSTKDLLSLLIRSNLFILEQKTFVGKQPSFLSIYFFSFSLKKSQTRKIDVKLKFFINFFFFFPFILKLKKHNVIGKV